MPLKQIKALLDSHEQRVLSGDTFDAVNSISASMFDVRMGTDDSHWRSACKAFIESHNLFHILQQDPYTRRAKEKPRGYAGDAVMLDYLYFQEPPPETTSLGREIFSCTVVSPGGEAVRWRAKHLAERIDSLSASGAEGSCLSVACGHLREVEYSESIRRKKATIIALDQDPQSLAIVTRDYSHLNVEPVLATVRDVIKGKCSFNGLRLAYAAGLYDYLPKTVALALTARLFTMLEPGGSVVVPNFLERNPVRGYMESFMDWYLILRSREEITDLAASIPQDQIASQRYYEDPFGVVGYLEITKGG